MIRFLNVIAISGIIFSGCNVEVAQMVQKPVENETITTPKEELKTEEKIQEKIEQKTEEKVEEQKENKEVEVEKKETQETKAQEPEEKKAEIPVLEPNTVTETEPKLGPKENVKPDETKKNAVQGNRWLPAVSFMGFAVLFGTLMVGSVLVKAKRF